MASWVWHTCMMTGGLGSSFRFCFNVVCKFLVDRFKNYFYLKANLLSHLLQLEALKGFLFLIPTERQKCCRSDASHFEIPVQFSSAFRPRVGIS